MKRFFLASIVFIAAAASALANDLERRASWEIATPDRVRQGLFDWLKTQEVDELTQTKIDLLWPKEGMPSDSAALLEQLSATFTLLYPETKPVVNWCREEHASLTPPKFEVLAGDSVPPWVRNNLRLLYGRWLAQHDFYDEAQEQLQGLSAADVADPGSLLFYQSVVSHRLLEKEQCLQSVTKLLENADAIPQRYATMAKLMEADIKPLKTDSLDEVARMMDDIRRRLNFGRAGKRVRQEEEDVVAKLDKMIEELEKQAQQQQQQQQQGGSNQSSRPMEDSQLGGGGGPGDVDPKRLPQGPNWGNLPAKQRQEALQDISKEFPAHYREAIEEYFRKLAQDGASTEP